MNFVTGLTNTTYNQNGAVTNKSTLSACLDLFSMGVSASLDKIILIEKALAEDIITAIKVVFISVTAGAVKGIKTSYKLYSK